MEKPHDESSTPAVESAPATGSEEVPKPKVIADPTINEEERAVMKQVAEACDEDVAKHCGDILGDPSRLVKYCRARQLKTGKIVKMIKETMKFRVKRHSEDLLTRFKPKEDFATVLKFPVHYLRDRDGGLVLFHRTGRFCGSYFCKYYSSDYLIDLVTYCLEVLTRDAIANMYKTGAPPYITFVLDFEGYGSHTLGPMNITQKLINVFQNHFPETMKRAVVINTPWLFRAVWTIVQAFLDPVVKSKIKVKGSGGLDHVQKFCDDDQIPAWLGGAYMHNGDESCASVIAQGGMPPKPDLPKGQQYIA